MKFVLLWIIRVYQKLFSFDHSFWANPSVIRICRYEPSCSEYTYQAIDKYGIFKGGKLGIKRIISCNPFGGSGYDPVP